MGETENDDGFYTCERCGKVKPVSSASACACGGSGGGQGRPVEGEDWDPEPTRSSRPRLSLVRRPEQGE